MSAFQHLMDDDFIFFCPLCLLLQKSAADPEVPAGTRTAREGHKGWWKERERREHEDGVYVQAQLLQDGVRV